MKKHSIGALLFLSIVGVSTLTGSVLYYSPDDPSPVPMTILHWNDFHSQNIPTEVRRRDEDSGRDIITQIGGYAALAGLVDSIRAAEERTLVLHAGDDFQGSPVSLATFGESQLIILNLIQPDVFALGNHEFDYGTDRLSDYVVSARFPVICANVINAKTGEYIVSPYTIVEKSGVKIAVIGLMSPDFEILIMKDNIEELTVLDPAQTVRALFPTIKNYKPHLIVALSHMGVDEDKVLAANVPELDLIVGGHSHTPLFSPIIENGVPIVQAGSRGRYLGRIDVLVDTLNNSIDTFTAHLIELYTDALPRHEYVAAVVDSLEALVDEALSEVIGILETDWIHDREGESNIGNWQADVMRSVAKTDIAFQNNGGIRKSLLAGPITVRDIWEINPFGNTFVTFSVTGVTLKQIIERQIDGRGERMQVSGLYVRFDPEADFGSRAQLIRINGEPLRNDKEYSIVTNNYVAGHAKMLLGIDGEVNFTDLYVIDRDVFITTIRAQRTISSRVEGRIAPVHENTYESQ